MKLEVKKYILLSIKRLFSPFTISGVGQMNNY